jgi:hypothetical protein
VARLAGEGRGRAGGGGGLRRVAAGRACLSTSSTAPALSGSLAVRAAAGEGGREAIDRCSAEAVARSVSEVSVPGGPPCCMVMVTHDHLLAASGSETPPPETPPPETPPPAMLLGVERLASGSAVAGLGSAGCREERSSVRHHRRAVGQGTPRGKHAAAGERVREWCGRHRLTARSRRWLVRPGVGAPAASAGRRARLLGRRGGRQRLLKQLLRGGLVPATLEARLPRVLAADAPAHLA